MKDKHSPMINGLKTCSRKQIFAVWRHNVFLYEQETDSVAQSRSIKLLQNMIQLLGKHVTLFFVSCRRNKLPHWFVYMWFFWFISQN